MRKVIWSAVAAAALAVVTVVLGVLDRPEALPVGLAAITAAILSNREVR
jgi:hypothetical protein